MDQKEFDAYVAEQDAGESAQAWVETANGLCVPAGSIQEEPVRWIYELYIEQAALNEIIGNPSGGKTSVAIDICARLTRGQGFPDNLETPGAPRCVMYLSGEDHIRRSLKPRLRVAGADMNYVYFIQSEFFVENEDGLEVLTPLVFPDHIPQLEEHIVANKVAMIVIDPVTGFFNEKTNTHNDAQVRKAFAPLRALAERTDCAILSIRHLNKMSSEHNPLYRGGGSIGLTAAPRSSLLIDFNPLEHGVSDDDPRRQRVLASNKINDAPKPPSRAFCIVADEDDKSPQTPYGIAHIEWLRDPVLVTARDLLRPQHQQRNSEALTEAMDFLRDELGDGNARLSEEVEKHATALKISKSTLKRARNKLKVIAEHKNGAFGGPWTMRIPLNDGGEPIVDDGAGDV